MKTRRVPTGSNDALSHICQTRGFIINRWVIRTRIASCSIWLSMRWYCYKWMKKWTKIKKGTQEKKGNPSSGLPVQQVWIPVQVWSRADRWETKISIEMKAELNFWMPLWGVTLFWRWQEKRLKSDQRGDMHCICRGCSELFFILSAVWKAKAPHLHIYEIS